MERRNQRRRLTRGVPAGLLMAGLLTGCYPDRQYTWDAEVPPPAGTHTHGLLGAQAEKARADAFVIYANEWYLGGPTLGPFGTYHLEQIARRLPTEPTPVVIQPTADPGLNQARQQMVVQYLTGHGVPDAAARVVLSCPQGEGLYGECEAERAFIQMLHPPYFPPAYGSVGAFPYAGYTGFNAFRGY